MHDKPNVDPNQTYVLDDDELTELEGLRLTRVVEALKDVDIPPDEDVDQEG